jgi:hypothetical protein
MSKLEVGTTQKLYSLSALNQQKTLKSVESIAKLPIYNIVTLEPQWLVLVS